MRQPLTFRTLEDIHPGMKSAADVIYSSSRNTRDFSREIRAQSEIWLHREYNLAMKNKSLRRIADMRSGRRLRAAHVAARTPRRS